MNFRVDSWVKGLNRFVIVNDLHSCVLKKIIDYDIFMDISYLKLEDGYEKYGFSPGIFKEF